MSFEEQFPTVIQQGWSNHLHFEKDDKGRISPGGDDFVLSARDVQKKCLDKQKVKEAIEKYFLEGYFLSKKDIFIELGLEK